MTSALSQLVVPVGFLVANVACLLLVLRASRRVWTSGPALGACSHDPPLEPTPSDAPEPRPLDAKDILGWEFDYAKTTATQAMQDRHTMVNFYLLAVGIVASGVVAVLGKDSGLPRAAGALLLWSLCGIGWLYFLKLIRLRQAWHDSSRAMNQIKDFYVEHSEKFAPDVLRRAFRWQSTTLPRPDQPWTVFFYSAMLIAMLDSVAYGVGAALLCHAEPAGPYGALGAALTVLAVLFFCLHTWLYFAFLKPRP